MYFGLVGKNGGTVSDEQWMAFLEKEIAPRFPNGLTVVPAYGMSAVTAPPSSGETTKLLIVVHDNTNEAQQKFAEIDAAYQQEFGPIGMFRVDFPVRIAQ